MNAKPILLLAAGLLFSAPVFSQKTESRTVADFSTVSISGGYDKVRFVEGGQPGVKITASGIDLDKILTETDGRSLNISMKNGSYNNVHIAIEVTFKSLEEVSCDGSADIEVEKLRGDHFAYNGSGSGDFSGDFDVKKLTINVSGSSDSKLKGRAERQEINISGSGDVDASKLAGSRADVAISGSGDVKLNVERVRSSVSGSGEVENLH